MNSEYVGTAKLRDTFTLMHKTERSMHNLKIIYFDELSLLCVANYQTVAQKYVHELRRVFGLGAKTQATHLPHQGAVTPTLASC